MDALVAFMQDMSDMDTAEAWQQKIDEQEQRLEIALKKMVGHKHDMQDSILIVAYCGMSDRVFPKH